MLLTLSLKFWNDTVARTLLSTSNIWYQRMNRVILIDLIFFVCVTESICDIETM